MPAQLPNNDVALPHAGLLAYFHPSSTSAPQPSHSRPAPPPYDVLDTPDSAHIPSAVHAKVDDEESCYDFWGERDSEVECDGLRLRMVKRDHQGFYSFCCFWCAVLVCFIGAIGFIFTADLALSSIGMGTGIAKGLVDASTYVGKDSYDIHFCLVSANREAPGPQIWRYISVNDIAKCKTEVVTLSAASTEHWKLRLDDNILLGDDIPHKAGFDEESRFMAVDKKAHIQDMDGAA